MAVDCSEIVLKEEVRWREGEILKMAVNYSEIVLEDEVRWRACEAGRVYAVVFWPAKCVSLVQGGYFSCPFFSLLKESIGKRNRRLQSASGYQKKQAVETAW